MTDVAPLGQELGQPIIVYPSAWKLLGLAVAWGSMAALILWATLRGMVLAVPFLVLFVCAAAYAVYRVIQRSPVLIISHEGISHNVLGLRPQQIAWAEIKSVRQCLVPAPYGLFSFRYLAVTPQDPEAFLAQQTGALRWLLRWYMQRSPAPIMIPQHILPVSIDWIMQRLHAQYAPLLHTWVFRDDMAVNRTQSQPLQRGQRRL